MDLKADLAHFTGTEQWFRCFLNRKVTYTEGVKYFAEKAGAYWLLDILATELPGLVKKHGMIFVSAESDGSQANLVAVRDKGEPPLWHRHVDFTDLPAGEWPLWMGEGGPGGTMVIMLPSEY
jgi:hypothetical protein